MLTLKNIDKSYSQEKQILKNINFSLSAGDCLFIKGVSGVGKTTLLNIMALLDTPDSGEILYNDKNLLTASSQEKDRFMNEDIGIIFQKYNLMMSLSVLDNVIMPVLYRDFTKIKKYEADAQVILDKLGLGEYTDKKINELSGGQQQRVAIARVLLQNPGIILADEPTANVDKETEAVILRLFVEARKQGKIIVIVSHNNIYKNIANLLLELK